MLRRYYDSLSAREQRTLRRAGMALGLFLVFYGGLTGYEWLEARRVQYQETEEELAKVDLQATRLATRYLKQEQLLQRFPIDFDRAADPNLITEVRPFIEKMATEWGLECDLRESETRNRGGDRTLQLDIGGESAAVLGFRDALLRTPYPLIENRFELNRILERPGTVQLSLKLSLLQYDPTPKKKRGRRARS